MDVYREFMNVSSGHFPSTARKDPGVLPPRGEPRGGRAVSPSGCLRPGPPLEKPKRTEDQREGAPEAVRIDLGDG